MEKQKIKLLKKQILDMKLVWNINSIKVFIICYATVSSDQGFKLNKRNSMSADFSQVFMGGLEGWVGGQVNYLINEQIMNYFFLITVK